MAKMGSSDAITDFFMIEALDLFNSSSSEPSSTIRIKPMVPKTGNSQESPGIFISSTTVSCLTPQPRINKNMTDGILVLEEVR